MSARAETFLAANPDAVRVSVARVKGSAPREAGAFMLVAETALWGTIGGGRLEHDAITAARAMLAGGALEESREIILGPGINQCCGGSVMLQFSRLNAEAAASLGALQALAQTVRPAVLLFGAGHVGLALVRALSPLPFNTRLIDTRPEFAGASDAVDVTIHAMPETLVRDAPAGAAILVLTHEHALDFLIAAEALKRDDLAYVGLIGSKTKKAVFRSQFLAEGGTLAAFARLVCPIGANPTGDKRPEIIAAFVAAELCTRLLAPKP